MHRLRILVHRIKPIASLASLFCVMEGFVPFSGTGHRLRGDDDAEVAPSRADGALVEQAPEIIEDDVDLDGGEGEGEGEEEEEEEKEEDGFVETGFALMTARVKNGRSCHKGCCRKSSPSP